MRAVSRGALASVCWHCSMQSGCTAVRSYIVGEQIISSEIAPVKKYILLYKIIRP